MRTTLTLDDNLLWALKNRAAEQNVPLKVMVHQVLQKGLESMDQQPKSKGAYCTPVRSMQPRPGLDLDALGRTADEQGDEDLLRRLS